MNEIIVKGNIRIEDMIYEVRGVQVMLDSDLAELYNCINGTKTINLAVKRHINRFPERFMFKLSNEESKNIRFQIETKNGIIETRGGKYDQPYVFTEQGVAMLATVLRTNVAEEISIRIMDAFVAMRHYIGNDLIEQKYINNLVLEDHDKIKALEILFQKIEEKRRENEIYFNGQVFDAYSKIQEIFNGANKSLIVIDAYADNTLLDIIKRLNVDVIIITKSNNLLTKQDIEKYNKQYHNLDVIYNNTFHDRYFVIDKNIIYHCGASVNRIGYKTFSINLINDKEVIDLLLDKIDKII